VRCSVAGYGPEDGQLEAMAINAGVGAGGDVADLNVVSTVHLAKRVLPGMVDRGRGRVLLTSSIASMVPST
jgi:short-subunit dehydrogenase